MTNVVNKEQTTSQSRIASLMQVKTRMDYVIKDFTNTATNISSRYDMTDLFEKEASENGTIDSILEYYETTLPQQPEIIMYQHGSNLIYTSGGPMQYEAFESSLGTNFDITMVRLYKRLNSAFNFQLFSNKYKFPDVSENYSLFFLFPLPYSDMNPNSSALFILDSKSIVKTFEDYMGLIRGDVFIFDSNLNLSFHSGLNTKSGLQDIGNVCGKLKKLKGTGINSITADGSDRIVIHTVSEDSGLSYYVMMSRGDYYESITRTKLKLFGLTGLSVLVVILLALLLASYN
jgi:hypothetical protein